VTVLDVLITFIFLTLSMTHDVQGTLSYLKQCTAILCVNKQLVALYYVGIHLQNKTLEAAL